MELGTKNPLLWARFKDDIYIPWTYGQELLEVFHEWLEIIGYLALSLPKIFHHVELNFLIVLFTVVKITSFKLNHTVRHAMNTLT